MSKQKMCLRERISRAKSAIEVEKLLKEGETYTGASDATRAEWQKAARRRLKRLGAWKEPEVKEVADATTSQ